MKKTVENRLKKYLLMEKERTKCQRTIKNDKCMVEYDNKQRKNQTIISMKLIRKQLFL